MEKHKNVVYRFFLASGCKLVSSNHSVILMVTHVTINELTNSYFDRLPSLFTHEHGILQLEKVQWVVTKLVLIFKREYTFSGPLQPKTYIIQTKNFVHMMYVVVVSTQDYCISYWSDKKSVNISYILRLTRRTRCEFKRFKKLIYLGKKWPTILIITKFVLCMYCIAYMYKLSYGLHLGTQSQIGVPGVPLPY